MTGTRNGKNRLDACQTPAGAGWATACAAERFGVIASIVATVCLFAATVGVTAEDESPKSPTRTSWPCFRNGNTLNGVATSPLPEKLKLWWKRPSADGIIATAAIVGNRVYVGCLSGELLCLDRKTGREIWKYVSAKQTNPNIFIPGFQSSPAVTDQSVFLGDEDGVFHAVDRETGKRRWTITTDAEIISSPIIFHDRVLFGSYDSSLYCLKQSDGSVVWKFTAQDRINGSPALAGDYTFVTGCDQTMRVIDVKTGKESHNLPLERFMIASPAVVDNMLYVGTHEGDFLAIDWRENQVVWTYRAPKGEYPYHSSAAVKGNRIVVGGEDRRVHCIDRLTGESIWLFQTRGQVDSSPVIVGNRVFVGSNDGNLYELKLDDGSLIWKFNAGRDFSASPAIGEGCLVIGTEASDGVIYCFGAATE